MQKNCTKAVFNVLDVFRLIFAVCVVAIHTHALNSLPQTAAFWLTQGVFRLAVPFFFVTSGFLLGRKLYGQNEQPCGRERNGTGQGREILAVLKRYSARLAAPLFLAGGANAALELLTRRLRDGKSLRYLAEHFVRHILFYPYGAMWFVQACIIGVWLLYPFLKRKKTGVAVFIGMLLYGWALLCNNYYFLAQAAGLDRIVDSYMNFFISARNGVFVAFLFLALGIQTWKWHTAKHSVSAGRRWHTVRSLRHIILIGVCLLYVLEIYLTQNCAYLDDRALYLTHILLVPLMLLSIVDIKFPISDSAAVGMRKASVWLYFSHRFIYGLGGLLYILKFRAEWCGPGAFVVVLVVCVVSFIAVCLWRSAMRDRFCGARMLAVCTCTAVCVLIMIFSMSSCLQKCKNWRFAAYGTSMNSEKTLCTGSYGEGEVTIENTGSGKMVPYGADGLSFYYTKLDASRDNFILSAQITVDSWTMTNGEDDGFGLMVCDSVGEHGDGADFWNNSYMAAVTKVEYWWNSEMEKVSNVGEAIVMRQGIAAREKIGSTEPYPEDMQKAAHAQTVRTYTLEESQGRNGAGTYNIIGNCTPITDTGGEEHPPLGTVDGKELLTTMQLEICRDNTGYRLRYIEEDGTVHEKLFYDIERANLAAIDARHVYVGFFAARRAHVTFHDMKLTVTDAQKDPAAEEPRPEVLDPDFKVTSSHTANSENYELVFETNYAGTLTVRDEQSAPLLTDMALSAGESYSLSCRLREGENRYEISFLPGGDENNEDSGDDQDDWSRQTVLSNWSGAVFWHAVSYHSIGDREGNIYTSPDLKQVDRTTLSAADLTGVSSTGKQDRQALLESSDRPGTKEHPVSLSEAVQYAAPGQRILLAEGEYCLSESLVIEQGHDGTEDAPIYLMSDPENGKRPVLNFQGKCSGITLSADHWVFDGFDCTGSAVNEYGIHLTGSNNRLEELEIYRNGNTGLHISSRSLWDDADEWPSDNLILNCTSYGNCDDAYEDADGFACQFTAGSGNVFDGCTAHHNADDGWDFYAKVWLEPLGPVTVKNCTAYCNGYLEDGSEAGNGNGFKLGGDGMPGGHILENCLSYENKKDGFTSNSCPDVTLIDCTAIDNGERNIHLYTKNQKNTAYVVQNFRSMRTNGETGGSDILAGRGTQATVDLYSEGNYYWDAEKQAAVNSVGGSL